MKEYKDFHLFCGLGGAALGFKRTAAEYRGMVGRFHCIGGIDVDPAACEDFQNLVGVPATRIDLFTRRDYVAFHGKEPPTDWREATSEEIRAAAQYEYPDVVFLSPPCKGFSGLLPSKKAASEKYQALNRLVVRGLKLTLEAFSDDLPACILLENVPRITTRGSWLLKQVKNLLKNAGYEIHPPKDQDGYHDCGELGGLGQHRKRYLLIARLPEKMTSFIYKPPKRRVKSIGEIIGPLLMPDDPGAGPMHRLPRLKWLTWVRLALIPAGGDWRDLEKLAPEQYRLEYVPRGAGSYGVQDWGKPGSTVVGSAYIKGSNPVAVADPRLSPSIGQSYKGSAGLMGVLDWGQHSKAVTGRAAATSSNCPATVADPRLPQCDNRFHNKYQLHSWDEPAATVTGIADIQAGAPSIADPRTGFKGCTHTAIYRVVKWDNPAGTVTGAMRPNNGAPSVADPRMNCSPRNGTMGVQTWDQPGATVIGAGDIHAGTAAVADPRMPTDNDRPDPPPVIISLDGTWHRPLTTLELAALQGFPVTLEDGSPMVLSGKSDARWRERIGNAVPPPAAKAIAEQILNALLVSEFNEWTLGSTGVWVTPQNEAFPHAEIVTVNKD